MSRQFGSAGIDRRRRALLAAGAAVGVGGLTASRLANAQVAPRLKLVALLVEGPAFTGPSPDVLAEQRRHGWIDGQNVRYERRGFQRPEELPALVAEILAMKPDLVVTYSTPAALAMKQATRTIPVIFNVGIDPVETGLVASLARPGGNLTGFYDGQYDGRKLQLIKEVQPRASLVVYPQKKIDATISDAAQTLGLQVRGIDLVDEHDIERFLVELRHARADAVVVPPLGWLRPTSMVRLAAEFLAAKIPAVGPNQRFADAGGLLAFGPKYSASRGVAQADQILRGANPADLPVELPTEFNLAVNLKTAKAFGLTVPQSLRLRADQIIS